MPGAEAVRVGSVSATPARNQRTVVLQSVHLVPLSAAVPAEPVDVLVRGSVVERIEPRLPTAGADDVVAGQGRWLIPGLWDAHVHVGQWAATRDRLDLRTADSPADAVRRVADHLQGLARRAAQPPPLVIGYGHRTARWEASPTVAQLDAATGPVPVVLVSGDAHHGWLNSAALQRVGLAPRDGVVLETQWYPIMDRLSELAGGQRDSDDAVRAAMAEAAARGIVGVVDLEFHGTLDDWPRRVAAGLDSWRVRAGVYPEDLDRPIRAGLRTGMPIDGCHGLVTMGGLKLITDGSLNTRTAYCDEPFADSEDLEKPCGMRNFTVEEMQELMARAQHCGLHCQVHAIGDAAVADALDAYEQTGARGTIEHAQLVRLADLPRMARLGIVASVQPAHLVDDRDVTDRLWPDRTGRCFAFRSMVDSGVPLRFGSDAPVSPLDPWLAMAAAVHRGQDGASPWHPEQALTAAQALAASTDGAGTVGVGSTADLVLLDADPLTAGTSQDQAALLRGMSVALTMVAGRITHDSR